jgi:threonine synthase
MTLCCIACGWNPGPPGVDPYPFRCPNAGRDDGDHVVTVVHAACDAGRPSGTASIAWPDLAACSGTGEVVAEPFLRYRSLLYSWRVAIDNGLSDGDYVALVRDLDAAVARVDGAGFRVTPCSRHDELSAALRFDATGGVWVKNETGNVSGSHKGRHLMGVALYLRVLQRLGLDDPARALAVASCGNAALAAAVVACALERQLLVFVPDHASSRVVSRLEHLGACVTHCPRVPGESGDPSYAACRDAVARGGALPFGCQGNENGLAVEGATTIVFEMLDAGVLPDRLFIQVGGGALASACVQGLATAVAAGRLRLMPRIHAVQTRGGYPLRRAYDALVEHLFARLAEALPSLRVGFASDADRARYLARTAPPGALAAAFAYARAHRSEFMRPWETEPRSVAGGILDDETYDWAVVVEAMIRTGGFPVVVDEATIEEAHALARGTTGIDVDHTGSAGLAGLVALTRSLDRPPSSERVAVLFTGATR